MNKKTFILSVSLIFACVILYRYNSREINPESKIKLANIEALVNNEGEGKMSCYKKRNGTGQASFELYCKNCSYMFADSFEDNNYCSR